MKNCNNNTMRGHRTPMIKPELLYTIENIYNMVPYADDI